ncbi:MAG: hypothetical protein P8K27_02275 [Gammaproteobacteria bacterium]|nr:hypothetical protein [Gammaproteobacteria bacterium]
MSFSAIKFVLPAALIGGLSVTLYQQNIVNENLLDGYKNHVQHLLDQVEEGTKDRISKETELTKLQAEIDRLNKTSKAQPDQAAYTEKQKKPDYQEIERALHQRIIYEYELDRENQNTDSQLDLITEISSLEPSALNELMSLQNQFGPFIQALNVDEERMEKIVGVLSNYVSQQNQARQLVLLQAQSEQIGRREIGQQMRAIMSLEVMYEELAYDLSQNEISILKETHNDQETESRFRSGYRPRFSGLR